jgi:class 3 adenylate cyclase
VTLTAEEPGWESTSHSFDAVVGFVDLAGFTACADALSRSGPAGTEELVSLINALFGPAIDCIHAAGGEVGWFAGDAMGVLFDTSVTPPMQALRSLIDASACIAGVQPLIVDGELITMTAKVGIAAGLVDWQWVGSEFGADERVGWFGGNAIDASAAAEHFATAGDVIADASFVRLAPIVGEQLPDGFVRIEFRPCSRFDATMPFTHHASLGFRVPRGLQRSQNTGRLRRCSSACQVPATTRPALRTFAVLLKYKVDISTRQPKVTRAPTSWRCSARRWHSPNVLIGR